MLTSLSAIINSVANLSGSSNSGRRKAKGTLSTTASEVLEVRQVLSGVSLGVVEGDTFKLDAQDANDTRAFAANTEVHFRFGLPGDTVFIGDWAGNGPGPVAVRQPGVNGAPNDGLIHWYFDTNGDLAADRHVAFGLAGDNPVVGDWDGNGRDDIGVTRKSGGAGVANDGLLNWFLSSNSTGTNFSHRKYGFSTDTPVVGNWDGRGGDDLGIVRPDGGGNLTWMQDRNGDTIPDRVFNFGRVGDQPVTGDWDGNGTDNVGVARKTGASSLQWQLDTNGNSTPDVVRSLNATGATPVVVDWGKEVQQQSPAVNPAGGVPVAVRLQRPTQKAQIDLRLGNLSNTSSSVAISSNLQNVESISIGGHRPETFVKAINGDSFAHQIGRAEGNMWSVNVNDTPGRFLAYGPYMVLQEGAYAAHFSFQIDNNTADKSQILTIDVFDVDLGKVVTSLPIRRNEFQGDSIKHPKLFTAFTLDFNAISGHRYEFRTFWHGGVYVKLKTVVLFSVD